MDERVTSAIAHWAPRFTTNGVTVSDFERITGGLDDWAGWCAAWSSVAAEHEALGREALAAERSVSAGQHLSQAAVYFHFAKFVFVEDLDQMREAHRRAVSCLDAALPYLRPPGRRVVVPFEGAALVGVLRSPAGPGPHPTVLMIPGLDSTKEELRSTEDTFLARNLATFSVDGPGQGEAEYDLPIRGDWSGPAQAFWDALSEQPEVDESRLGIWGVSLGGYYAPRVAAALGERAKACVSLSGPFNFGDCWDQLPDLTKATLRVRSGAADDAGARAVADTLSLEKHAADIVAPLLLVAGRPDPPIPRQQSGRLRRGAGGPPRLLVLGGGKQGGAHVAPRHP